MIEGLTVGETYTFVEKVVATTDKGSYVTGYVVADSIEFTVEELGDSQQEQKVQIIDTMNDEHVYGQITVTKQGEVLTGTEEDEDGNITFTYETKNLSNATYEIYAKEDIVAPDGVSEDYYKAGKLVETITTGSDGTATSSKLPLGTYYVKETTAPEGYVLNDEQQDVTLTYANQTVDLVFDEATFENARQTVDLTAVKKDSETGETVAGAQFTLYAAENIADYKGNILVEAGDKIQTVTTDDDGNASFTDTLPLSTYTVKETAAPDGYYSTSKTYNVDASYQGQTVETIKAEVEVTNIITKVKLSKQDITSSAEIAGAYLQVFDSEGNLVDEWTSVAGENHIIEGLKVGETYTMIEKLAPEGYLQASEVEFTVVDNGDEGGVQEVTPMKDEQVKGKITVEKKGDVLTGITENEDGSIDFVYEEKGLANAVYEIYAKEDIVNPDGVSENYYDAGELVETLTTGSDGKATSSELPLGKYYVVETTAPEGYVLNTDQKDATLSYADQYTALVFDSVSFTNEKQGVEIKVIKQDKETGEYLEGAVFALYTTEHIYSYDGELLVYAGTEIGRVTTDETGTATYSQDLPLGQYQVKEVQAPKGYASTADDTIDIDASYQG